MKRSSIAVLVIVVLLGVAGGYIWWQNPFASPPAYRTVKVERGSITSAVASTGTLNPVVSVQVGSQVSGQIKELYVDYNSPVKKDQLIARIDPQSFSLRVNQAMADVDATRATALTARSNLVALNAEMARSKVMLRDAEREYNRNHMLFEKNFVSEAVRDKALATLEAAREQLKAQQAQVGVGEAQVRNADAIVKQRESQLAQARVDLERTEIRAPVDGTVVKKSVEPGQTVAASLQSPELFIIAQDLRQMQVDASIDESEVGRIRVGQTATFTVDSFPGRTFRGEVAQVRKAAQVVQNVVTYIAVVSASNPDLGLFPGMTANVRITVDTREDVLKVPNSALRFRPVGATDGSGPVAAEATTTEEKGKVRGQAFLERLQKELALSPDQRSRIESIMRETRAKIEDAPAEDPTSRKRAVERTRSESRSRIADVLTAEQRVKYEAMAGASRGRGATTTSGRVWVRNAEAALKPVSLVLGLTDGTSTELVSGDLKEGEEVIVGIVSESAKGAVQAPGKQKGPRFGF